jgi:RND family efflux transporter MFP subunit
MVRAFMNSPILLLPGRPERRRWIVALALAVVAAGPAACGRAGGPPPQMPPVPVEIVTLAPKSVEQTGEYVATVKSLNSSTIQPQAEGFLTRILVKSGDRVKPGTPLFEIDATTQQAAVAGLESVRAARAADATYARQQTERLKKLLEAGAVSQQEYDQAVAQQTAAEAQLRAAEDLIRQQRAELAFHRVTAPTAGIVGDVPVRLGDRVTRQTVLTTVADNTGLELHVNVPVQEGPKLKTGLSVRILDESGVTVDTEKVNFISPTVNDDTQTVLVKTPITGSSKIFRTDQLVRVRVLWSVVPTITAPLTSLNRINGVYFAFVAEAGPTGGLVARQRQVAVGPVVGNDYVILSGLAAGDRLIVSGIQKIADQAPVQEAPAGAPPGGPERGKGGPPR